MNAIVRSLVFILMSDLAGGAVAQTTSFTYQGQLKDGVNLAEGQHDFRFRLYDAVSGGTQLGAIQCVDNIQVRDGVFTTTIDFGNQFATPNQRFIEIEVRRDTGLSCANVGGFVVLAPRQPITPAPTATQAASAFSLASPDGSPAKAVFVANDGKVGIGTLAPTHWLHVAAAGPTLALQDTNAASQQAGYVSYRDNANIERAWVGYGSPGDPDFSIVNARTGGDIILNAFSGNVGIGTASPAAKLDVRGDIRLGSSGEFFAASGQENLRLVRGDVSSNGAVEFGQGFTCTRISEGAYEIRFTPPFARTPTVVAQAAHNYPSDMCWASVVNSGPGTAYIHIRSSRTTWVDTSFSICVIGPR